MQNVTRIKRKHGTVLIETSDWDRLCKEGWSLSVRLYKNIHSEYRAVYLSKPKMRGSKANWKTPLARWILDITNKGLNADHKNRDSLDNRRANLRVCSKAQDTMNRAKFKGRSKYKGVHFCKTTNKWRAESVFERKRIRPGRFVSEIAAARAYDTAAKTYFKEFSALNF